VVFPEADMSGRQILVPGATGTVGGILARPVFERLLFSQCWEDPEMDRAALEVGPGKTLVSATSGGCNTLSLALQEPSRIVAFARNAAQNHLLEVKIAGARLLSHGRYLEMLGVVPSDRRTPLYGMCRPLLSAGARCYWDRHLHDIESGILRAGRCERYLEALRRLLLLLQGRDRIGRIFEPRPAAERCRFYEETWDTRAWRLFFRVFFSRTVLRHVGLDPESFTSMEGIGDLGEHFRSRARHALCDLPAEDNYFLAQICLGRYLDLEALPPYLREENFGRLRDSVGRIEIVKAGIGELLAHTPDDSVDCFALSTIFERSSPEAFETTLREIHRVARPGARLCYRNLLARRRYPASLDGLFSHEDELAARLLDRDRSFVYSHLEVATACKGAAAEGSGDAHLAAAENVDPSLLRARTP
jgi:S-adenosylmethionine-diacylglycerol 3-amino-3-carboxypropyl transferase